MSMVRRVDGFVLGLLHKSYIMKPDSLLKPFVVKKPSSFNFKAHLNLNTYTRQISLVQADHFSVAGLAARMGLSMASIAFHSFLPKP